MNSLVESLKKITLNKQKIATPWKSMEGSKAHDSFQFWDLGNHPPQKKGGDLSANHCWEQSSS